ncbi:protein piccolo-like [Siniperca chuatsi]|uniref:protein piccolo-like n=1 Tax=Siniperca chuatsi TaxID=119488 RepID=UPI001CE1E02B|nr:protein piccolo-like [Siniperca chuatsi]XP_044038989.1 protein piccolo-like [Siniperca chuatsi]
MDPVLFSLPEIILNDRKEPDCTQSGFSDFSPHYHQLSPADTSASQEKLHIPELSEPSLQMSHEIISRVGQSRPSRPRHVMNESASLRTSTVAKMLRTIANSDQRTDTQSWTQRDSNQQSVQHLIQMQAQDSPSPLKLQTLLPGARSQPVLTPLLPELIFTSSSPQDWLNISPIEFWYSPYSPPRSWLLLPLVRPSWCLCPQTVPVHQPCSPDLVSRKAAQQVSQQLNVTSAASGKAENEEQAKSEEEKLKICTPDKDKPQANNIDDKTTKSKVSPGCLPSLDEESLAEHAFEEYMTIMDSFSPKIQAGMEAKENENEVENSLILEFLDELCSNEDLVTRVESALNIEFLDSLLSSDAEPIDLLAFDKQEQEETLQEHQPSADATIDPATDGTSLVGPTLSTEYLDSPLSSDPEPIYLLPLRKLQQEALEVILQQQLHPPSANSNSIAPVTEETSPATSHAEETAPLQRAQSPILDPPGSKSDTNPNHDGQNAPLSMRNIGSKEGWTPLLPSLRIEEPLPTAPTPNNYNPVNAMSPLGYDGSLFMDYSFNSSLQLLANISQDTSLTSDLEARDNDSLVEEPAAIFPTGQVSEATSMSFSNLADTQSAQTSQMLQEGPLPGDPPASEPPTASSVSGSNEDPHTIAVKKPAPSFRADLLTVSPPQSAGPPALRVLARKTLPRPLPPPPAQIREPEEQCSPKNKNPNSSCLEHYAVPVPANLSFVADSHAESCDAPGDGNLSDSVPEKQPKGLVVSQELASSDVSSEVRTGEWGETERKCEKGLGKGVGTTVTQKQTAIKAREEGRTKKTFERKEEHKENETKVKGMTNTRRSQRLSGQTEKEKARLSGEFIMKRAEDRRPSEKSIKKTAKITPERDGVIYKKQKRRSSGGRQLSKREGRHFEEQSRATKTENTAEQFPETGEKEQHQKPAGEMQKLKVEGRGQCEANNPNVRTESGAENALSTKMAQEEKELGEGRVKRKEEGIQMSSFVRRRTRSTTTEEKVQPTPLPAAGARGKIKHSEMERSEIKSSPKRELQDDDKPEVNVKEDATEGQTLPFSSPVKRSRSRRDGEESRERANDANSTGRKTNEDKVSGNCSPPESSLQSPGVQTDIHSAKASKKQSSVEGPLDERNESPSAKTCEKNLNLTPALCSETLQQSKTVALSGGGADRQAERGEPGQHGDVTGTKTWDFYSLRSQSHKPNVSIRGVNRTRIQEEATHHPSNPKPSPDQTPDVKGEDGRINEEAERPSLLLSPMKRYRHERGVSEEREKRVNETMQSTDKVRTETQMISSSPVKRGRWKSRVEVNSERDEEQKLTPNEKGKDKAQDEAETSGCKPSPPSTRSNTRAKDEKISDLSAGQGTFKGGRSSAIETRKSRRRSEKLPSKYKDFILCKTNRPKRQLRRKERQERKEKMDN